MGLDELAALLGQIGYVKGESWFQLSDKVLDWSTRSATANHAVILRSWQGGPTAVVFPRNTSASASTQCANPGHTHKTEFPKCWLRQNAHVTLMAVTAPKDVLNEDSHLCNEEDVATIAWVKAARW